MLTKTQTKLSPPVKLIENKKTTDSSKKSNRGDTRLESWTGSRHSTMLKCVHTVHDISFICLSLDTMNMH